MSEAKHTPGPWEAGCHPHGPDYMNIVKPIMFGNRMGKLPECEGGHCYIRNEADARLIAAAPDLLAACKDAEQWPGIVGSPTWLKLCAAIANAEGAPISPG